VFWDLIDAARADARNCCAVVSNATTLLAQRPVPEIIAAHQAVQRLMDASYLRDLWAAAHLILHGCSDDGFDYFRGWLLTQGRHVFESAVADPDSLAAFDLLPLPYGGIGYCEDALYLAWEAHRIATGEDMPAVVRKPGERPTLDLDWDFDDDAEMRRRLPRLSTFYLM
jgi:Protein of unknown function (DUF4240)